MKTDISGSITRATIRSPLTPLFLLAALAAGLIALLTIPREEEPQISVPLVDIHVAAPGLLAADIVEEVTKPLEEIIKAIPEVEHVYSASQDDQALITARFDVGTDFDDAILRIHEKIRANQDKVPHNVPEPLVIGRSIDDVPIVTLTLSPEPIAASVWNDTSLKMIADELLVELVKIEDIGLTSITGGRPLEMRIEPDVNALASFGVPIQTLVQTVESASSAFSGRYSARARPSHHPASWRECPITGVPGASQATRL